MKKKNTIDNVREWYRATRPTEYQIDDIPCEMTFTWLGELLNTREAIDSLRGLDTMVRENIMHEALVRKLIEWRRNGRLVEGLDAVRKDGSFTDYGIKFALEDVAKRK